jgi:competence ComEA-like helix-hairpin-helix protein
MELKNIGAAKAEDLIEYRSAQPFKVPEDLIKVSGVGEATLSANKDCITVE